MPTLIATSFLPAIISFIFDYLLMKTKFKNISYKNQQLLIGFVFGLLAILFTITGIDVGSGVINIRNSAPICAGLLFGGPAGIIAGLMGGIYRYLCVYWGGGTFTQLACSITCVLAGFIAFGVRKYVFGNRRPNFLLVIGITAGIEVIHFMLILVTNVGNMMSAFEFVNSSAFDMTMCNILASGLAAFVVGNKTFKLQKPYPIGLMFSFTLLIGFIVLFAICFDVCYTVAVFIQDSSNDELLSINIDDVVGYIDEYGITDRLNTWRIGKSGGIAIADLSGNSLLVSRDGSSYDLDYLDKIIGNIDEYQQNVFYYIELKGEDAYCEYRIVDNYYVIAYMMAYEADISTYITYYMMLFTVMIIFITIFFLVYKIVNKTLIERLNKVNEGLNQISNGNLDVVIDVRTSQEFNGLSNDINHTVDTLKDLIGEAEKRNEKELGMAHQIQQSAVPFIFPPFPKRKDFDIYALMNTAKEVGGDFYDFYFLDDQHFVFLIADVSGKGIPAAMFMMAAKTLIKSTTETGKTVDKVFSETNEKLCSGNDAGMFLTAWLGIMDLETGHLSFVNAGHNPPLLCRKDGNYEYIKEKPNFILAGLESAKYTKSDLYLNPGDTLYLYTDGVTEAENNTHKLYGEQRLECILNKAKDFETMDICHIVEDDISKFVQDAPQSDDITMLSFRLNYLSGVNNITVRPDESSLKLVSDYMDEKLAQFNISEIVRNKVHVCVDEIYSNIVFYSGATKAKIKFGFQDERLAISFADNGMQFDPTNQQAPDTNLSAAERKIGGLGIYIVKKMSSALTYEYKDGYNCLNLMFDLKMIEKNKNEE